MVVYTQADAIADNSVRETMWGLRELAKEFETDDISISIAGQPAIRSDLIRSIASDVMFLAPIALLFCTALAFFLFRHPVAMVLCALPSVLASSWFIGGAGISGTSLNFLTNILPVLLIVIVFADTLHLYLKWQKLAAKEEDPLLALEHAIEEIGPACAISSLTTAAALLSLLASGNNGLFELGVVGAIAVIGGFLSVILGLPLALYWAIKSGYTPKTARTGNLAWFSRPAMALLNSRKTVLAAGLLLCLAGLFAHTNIDSRFRLIDYLGTASEVGQSEGYIDQTYYGTTPLFAIVDMDQALALDDPQNEKRCV